MNVMWILTAVPAMEPSFRDQDMDGLATVELRGKGRMRRLSCCCTDKPQAQRYQSAAYFRGRSPAQDRVAAGRNTPKSRGTPSSKVPLVSRPEEVTSLDI